MKRLLLGFLIYLSLGASFAHSQGTQLCFTTNGTNCIAVSPTNPLPVASGTVNFKNITTNASTEVKASPGTVFGIVVNTAGATSNVKLYDDADGTCSSNLVGTFSTLSQTAITNLNISMSIGICALTAGGTPADITILYR